MLASKSIEDFKDMSTLNEYQNRKNSGGDLDKFMERIRFESRDNGRTPFQWNALPHAGFTTGTPWIKVNPNYNTINAALQEREPNSCLNYFRTMVKLRKTHPALVYGKYTLLDKKNANVYVYTREHEGKTLLIVLNFSAKNAKSVLGIQYGQCKTAPG